jgi:uncharacterized membrane protein HdeD (DUF308 family)
MTDLATTNILLGIMAMVSVLEALAVIALLGGAYMLYRRILELLKGIEERQVAPVAARVNAILDDVKGVTSVVEGAAKGADSAARWGLEWLFSRLKRPAPPS